MVQRGGGTLGSTLQRCLKNVWCLGSEVNIAVSISGGNVGLIYLVKMAGQYVGSMCWVNMSAKYAG